MVSGSSTRENVDWYIVVWSRVQDQSQLILSEYLFPDVCVESSLLSSNDDLSLLGCIASNAKFVDVNFSWQVLGHTLVLSWEVLVTYVVDKVVEDLHLKVSRFCCGCGWRRESNNVGSGSESFQSRTLVICVLIAAVVGLCEILGLRRRLMSCHSFFYAKYIPKTNASTRVFLVVESNLICEISSKP